MLGRRGTAPRIFNLGTRWRRVVSFTRRAILPPQFPLNRQLGGPQSRSGCGGKEKNSRLCRESNPDRLTRSLMTTPAPHARLHVRVYPKVSGLAACSENCKWYSSLPLGEVVSLFCEFCRHNPLCCFSTSVYCCKRIFR
jgi:hypothetical protein